MNAQPTAAPQAPSAKKILIATLCALAVATVILFTTILPAEFGLDPLGTGRLLGISGLSGGETMPALNQQEIDYREDTYIVELAPFESVEYKYRLEEGASMLFEWEASGEVLFDLHSEQDGIPPDEYSPSFDQRQSTVERGSFTAPFPGIHGWFWENRSTSTVRLELNAVGFFTQATEFRAGFENHREF